MEKRPNVVFITTHDTGLQLGCYGVPTVRTPHYRKEQVRKFPFN